MKKTILALTSIGLLAGTAAIAQAADRGAGPTTRAEVTQKTAERFKKMDLNGDGVVDLTDGELRRKQMLARIDTDGNGAISKAEREAAREARQVKRAEWREERGIEDKARDGKRGKRGMRGMRGGNRGQMGGGGMMMRADANGDGRLTLAELQSHALARFDRVDTNSDGTISDAERKAAHEARQAERRERIEQRRAQRAGQ